jgi:hypothetical protein
MKPLVYIETTIPSFYYEIRTEPEIAGEEKKGTGYFFRG